MNVDDSPSSDGDAERIPFMLLTDEDSPDSVKTTTDNRVLYKKKEAEHSGKLSLLQKGSHILSNNLFQNHNEYHSTKLIEDNSPTSPDPPTKDTKSILKSSQVPSQSRDKNKTEFITYNFPEAPESLSSSGRQRQTSLLITDDIEESPLITNYPFTCNVLITDNKSNLNLNPGLSQSLPHIAISLPPSNEVSPKSNTSTSSTHEVYLTPSGNSPSSIQELDSNGLSLFHPGREHRNVLSKVSTELVNLELLEENSNNRIPISESLRITPSTSPRGSPLSSPRTTVRKVSITSDHPCKFDSDGGLTNLNVSLNETNCRTRSNSHSTRKNIGINLTFDVSTDGLQSVPEGIQVECSNRPVFVCDPDDFEKKGVKFTDAASWKKYSYKDFQSDLQTVVAPMKISHLPERAPIDLEFNELTVHVRGERKKEFKTLLNGVTGNFKHGLLVAIIGPSGAGKTTLMNSLAGFKQQHMTGTISVNGHERDLNEFHKQSCYIMQDNHLLPFLSILEYMQCAAALKLGDKYSPKEKEVVIQEILNMLRLMESRNTRVMHLSGGEKKRLSVALELVNNPPVMFLDEPTSGLDSTHSFQCVQLLKLLAEGGRTVICTIHQPSAKLFEKFDHLYALAEGRCVYRGASLGVVSFLSSMGLDCPSYHNPADFLIEIASGEYGSFVPVLASNIANGMWVNPGRKNLAKRNVENLRPSIKKTSQEVTYTISDEIPPELGDEGPPQRLREDPEFLEYPASFKKQFYVLFWRSFISIIRDSFLTKLRIVVHILVGIFIGLLYYKAGDNAGKVLSNIGCLFFGILFFTFTSMIPTTLTFPLEMNVFLKEHLNHWYSLKAYYLARTMADVPFQITFPIIYVSIAYFMTGQPLEAHRFFLVLYFAVAVSLVAQSIGLAIGAAVNTQQAVFCGPALAIPPLLFCGYLVAFSTIPSYMSWLTYLSYIRYAFEGTLLSIYGLNRAPLDCTDDFCIFKNPEKLLDQFDMDEYMLVWDAIVLVIFFFVIRIMGYFILRWKFMKER